MKLAVALFLYFIVIKSVLAQDDQTVLIMLEDLYTESLKNEMKTYENDLKSEGWNVFFCYLDKIIVTHDQLKGELATLYAKYYMSGVVLIGDFPYENDYLLACHKCSLVNTLAFSAKPDYWVSRIDPTLLSNTKEEDLLRDYFKRNHDFRRVNYNGIHSVESYSYYFLDTYKYTMQMLYSMGKLLPYRVWNKRQFWASINGADAGITEINAHGNNVRLYIWGDPLDTCDIFENSASKSRFINLCSCDGGATNLNNPASSFLFSPKSKVLAVLARTGDSSGFSLFLSHGFDQYPEAVGNIFLDHYSWINYVLPYLTGQILLGDGTIRFRR